MNTEIYLTQTGKKFHINMNCFSLKRSTEILTVHICKHCLKGFLKKNINNIEKCKELMEFQKKNRSNSEDRKSNFNLLP